MVRNASPRTATSHPELGDLLVLGLAERNRVPGWASRPTLRVPTGVARVRLPHGKLLSRTRELENVRSEGSRYRAIVTANR